MVQHRETNLMTASRMKVVTLNLTLISDFR